MRLLVLKNGREYPRYPLRLRPRCAIENRGRSSSPSGGSGLTPRAPVLQLPSRNLIILEIARGLRRRPTEQRQENCQLASYGMGRDVHPSWFPPLALQETQYASTSCWFVRYMIAPMTTAITSTGMMTNDVMAPFRRPFALFPDLLVFQDPWLLMVNRA